MLQGKKPARLFPSQRRVAPNAKRRVPLVDLRSDLVPLVGCEEVPTSLQSSFFPRTPSHAPRAVTPKECAIGARLPPVVHPVAPVFFGSLPGASRLTSFSGVRQRGGGDIGRALPPTKVSSMEAPRALVLMEPQPRDMPAEAAQRGAALAVNELRSQLHQCPDDAVQKLHAYWALSPSRSTV